jgi:LmbE family N-acetylglucosaminyl deacetylase
LIAILVGLYYYQPQRIDLFPRHAPVPNPPIDPDSRALFSKGTKVAIVTAHPDDAEFYLGGTLTRLGQAGAVITLIVCTNGDKSFYPWEDGAKLGKIRQGEQEAAYNRWHGSRLIFLGYPDGRLHPNDDVKERVLEQLRIAEPDYILAFDPDYPPRLSHGDHRAAGEVVKAIVHETSAKWLLMFQTIAANYTVDISRNWQDKKELLALHASQFSGNKLNLVTNLVEDMADKDGARISAAYGEGLRCVRLR